MVTSSSASDTNGADARAANIPVSAVAGDASATSRAPYGSRPEPKSLDGCELRNDRICLLSVRVDGRQTS
jgi:hypothetical protein